MGFSAPSARGGRFQPAECMEHAPTENKNMKEAIRGVVWFVISLYAVTFIWETEGGEA